MASRSVGYWKSMVQRLRTYATATTPKAKAYAPAADYPHVDHHQHHRPAGAKGDFIPVYVSIGMIALSAGFGLLTAYQHLRNNPSVRVSKKTRESLPEVENPDKIVEEADRFLNKSWFRKMARVQEFDRPEIVPDPIRKDQFAHKPHVVTLKDVGVDPKDTATAAVATR